MNNEQITFIKQTLKKHFKSEIKTLEKNGCAIYITGSSVYGFIDNPNDIDIAIYYTQDNHNVVRDALATICTKGVDGWSVFTKSELSNDVYEYLYSPFMICIFGTPFELKDGLKDYDGCKAKVKLHYAKLKQKHNLKRMYDILYYKYMLINRSHYLTEYQKKVINDWHDACYDEVAIDKIAKELDLC